LIGLEIILVESLKPLDQTRSMSRKFFEFTITAMVLLTLAFSSDDACAEVEFEDNPIGFAGIALGCAALGAPTCIATWGREDEIEYSRQSEIAGAELSYFPSYVLDFAESKAYQRFEVSGYAGNLILALSHRRGVQEPNYFSSTSYRVAYSFDWRHLRPAIGLGVRRNVNARNGDCFEIWLPLFANRSLAAVEGFSIFFETLWVIGPIGVRPEIQARLELQISSGFLLAAGLGYFADYENAESEISIGPTFYF